MLFYISAVIVIIILVIYFMPLRITINYKRKDQNDYLLIKLQIIPYILSYKIRVPVIKFKENMEFEMKTELKGNIKNSLLNERIKININRIKSKKIKKIFKISIQILKNRKKILKKIHCEKVTWKTQIGLSNPALTGISVGNIWLVKDWFYRLLYNNMQIDFNKPDFEVSPDFENNKFEMFFYCIFKARTGHVINIGTRILLLFIIQSGR